MVQVKILLPLCQLHTHIQHAYLRIQNDVLSSFTNREYGSALSECFDTPNFFDAEIYEETAFTTSNLLTVANSPFCLCLVTLKD